MPKEISFEDAEPVAAPASPGRGEPQLVLVTLLVSALVSAGLCAAAILAPAPPMAVPLAVVTCVGAPLFAGWEAPRAWAGLRAQRAGRKALDALRQHLNELPETEHPLGL